MSESSLTFEQLGRLLKNTRLEKKLELQAVARELHIRPRYLEALEEGELANLPGDTFIGGYLGRYATFLGLDAREITVAYRHLGALPPRRVFYIPAIMHSEPHPSRALVMISLVIVASLSISWHRMHADAMDVMALAFSAPKIVEVRARALAPECMQRMAREWPPCFQRVHPLPDAGLLPKPVQNVMGLRG